MQRMAALCEVWLPYSSPAVLISSTARSQPPSCTRSHSNHKCKAQDKAARATPCFVVQAQRFIAPGLLAMAQVMVHCPQLLTTGHGPGNGPLSTAPDYCSCSVVHALWSTLPILMGGNRAQSYAIFAWLPFGLAAHIQTLFYAVIARHCINTCPGSCTNFSNASTLPPSFSISAAPCPAP